MNTLKNTDPEIFAAISDEIERQQSHIELIASENYCSTAVMQAQGSVLTRPIPAQSTSKEKPLP